jgi:hypothetical protein
LCCIFNGDKIFQDKKKELWGQGIRAIKEARNIAFEYVSQTFDDLVDHHIARGQDYAIA